MMCREAFWKSAFLRFFWILSLILFAFLLTPPVRSFFCEIGARWLYIMLFAFSTSALLTPATIALGVKLGIVDRPGGRKIHAQATPRIGGAAIVFSFTAALLANMILDVGDIAIIAGGAIVAFVGFIDDWKNIRASYKLAIQVLVAIALIRFGIILDLFPIHTDWGYCLNAFLSVLWVVGLTNSMNFIDGMDGLATGISAVIALFLAIAAYQTNQPLMGWIALAMLGSCLGFLPFNFGLKRDALVFLGDAGSTFLGFVLAALAIRSDWADNNPIVSFATPILIFWILIYDMAYISAERVLTGKVKSFRQWIDYVGTDHIHHRIFAILKSKRQTVVFIIVFSATLGIGATVLRNASTADGIMTIVQAFLITVIVSILEYYGRNNRTR
jgi:UDP-GlcNAc:undecaprenyl-phosphate/decaprenyl-phosphate GlcNAc-1-phosphate transferase